MRCTRRGSAGSRASESRWELQTEFIAHLESIWQKPDSGIWEVRGEELHFTYSKAMAWVAFDRTIKSAERFGLDGPVDRWRQIRDEIHADICRLGFDKTLGSFVRSYGSQAARRQPAAAAGGRIPAGRRPAHHRYRAMRSSATLVTDGLVRRYNTEAAEDGLPAGEGVVPRLQLLAGRRLSVARAPRRGHAPVRAAAVAAQRCRAAQRRIRPYANRLIGNFPQAFSHLALVNSASNLAHHAKPAEQRSEVSVPGKAASAAARA